MDLPEAELNFLRDLVKASRQKCHQIPWTDRDGTARHTVLTPAENGRLGELAAKLRVSKADVLRQAAHIPVAKNPPRAAAEPPL